MCLLLVEDEPFIREVMAESLEDAGFEVFVAENGSQAIELLDHPPKPIRMLVTDFHMPGNIDGAQVAHHLRSLNPRTPVVIATGRPDVLSASWRQQFGYELLRKPYRPSELVALVGTMLRG